jgi:hypothetical protein
MQQAGLDVAAVDAERILCVSRALGAQRFGELLAILSVRLQRLSGAVARLPDDAAGLVAALHQSRGSATSLGLVGLAVVLTDLEAQITGALGGSGPISDPSTMARIKIAGGALHGYGQTASRAAAHHALPVDQAQTSGICIK